MNDTIACWVAGARPRTLPAAVAPILAGVASAAVLDRYDFTVAALCLMVSLALQVGVNYANDYSDGIRGTDDDRVGPVRLVASGLASPGAVRLAALASFVVAAAAGFVVVAITGHWWFLGFGVASVMAAWYYTGGRNPYGYRGLGEVVVFVFFGLVATVGTCYVISDGAPPHAWAAAVAVGALASAILVANNLRDIATDRAADKMTLPARLGDRRSRWLYAGLCAVSGLAIIAFAALTTWSALIALLGLGVLVPALRRVLRGAAAAALIPVLQSTSMAEVGVGFGLLVGVAVA